MVLKRHFDISGILSKIGQVGSERWILARNRLIDNMGLKMTPPNPVAKDITKILQRSDLESNLARENLEIGAVQLLKLIPDFGPGNRQNDPP